MTTLPTLTSPVAGSNQSFFRASLQTIQTVIRAQVTDPVERALLLEELSKIQRRLDDPVFCLAVAGQFSSGKSTFINALLRSPLLKARFKATTAVGTFITAGETFGITVTFRDGTVIDVDESDVFALTDHLRRKFHWWPGERSDLPYLIELLTTGPDMSPEVAKLAIRFPAASELLERALVIDTPGLFAGEDHANGHDEITLQIVRETADLAVFLMPAQAVTPKALLEVSQELPEHLLQHAVFIITGIDRIETEERQELTDHARRTIQKKLKIAAPRVLTCAALAMLPQGRMVPTIASDQEYWEADFRQLETELEDLLRNDRQAILAAKTSYLLNKVLTSVQQCLGRERLALETQRSAIQSKNVTRIEDNLGSLLRSVEETVGNLKNKISQAIAKHASQLDNIKTSARRKITYAGGAIYDEYRSIENELHREIETGLAELLQLVNQSITKLRTDCSKFDQQFERQFRAHYSQFDYLKRTVKVESFGFSDITLAARQFSSFQHMVEEKIKSKTTGATNGAFGGFWVGLLLGGPVGAVIGTLAGGAAGNSLSKEPLDTLQPKLIASLQEEISKNYEEAVSSVRKKVTALTGRILNDYRKLCTDHTAAYGQAIQAIIDQHQAAANTITRRIADLDADARQLQQIINYLSKAS